MAGYIYLPVPNAQMQQMAEEWRQGQIRKGKRPYQVIKPGLFSNNRKLLSNVTMYDKVYIVLHGGGQMSSRVGAGETSYSPKELAKNLHQAGLKQLMARDVRVYACGSGGHGTKLDGDGNSQYVPPFVRELRDEMTQLGYYRLAVYGYLASTYTKYEALTDDDGNAVPGGEHRSVFLSGTGLVRASEARVVFYGPLRTETDSPLPAQVHLSH